MVRLIAACSAGVGVLVLTGCGATRPGSAISVVSQEHDPIYGATVVIGKTHATTDEQGVARLAGMRPAGYEVNVSAAGYYSADARLRIAPGRSPIVSLDYRPPLGTFVWNIGPAGQYWAIATITPTAVASTEYDWTCDRNATGAIGRWTHFDGPLPEAIAPNTISPEWVRRTFPGGHPPTPRGACRKHATSNQATVTALPFGDG
jgi:hypothetical protein